MQFSLREARYIWQEAPLILPTNGGATPSERQENTVREARIAEANAAPDQNGEAALVLPASNETPSDRAGGKIKLVADALNGNRDVRDMAEQQAFKLRLNLALKSAFKAACNEPGFRRLNGQNTYTVQMGPDNTATLMYATPDNRFFMAKELKVGGPGSRMTQTELIRAMGDVIAKDGNFAEVIAPQIRIDNE